MGGSRAGFRWGEGIEGDFWVWRGRRRPGAGVFLPSGHTEGVGRFAGRPRRSGGARDWRRTCGEGEAGGIGEAAAGLGAQTQQGLAGMADDLADSVEEDEA